MATPFRETATQAEIKVPDNVVQFSVSRYSYNGRYQLRGVRVYDLLNRSFTPLMSRCLSYRLMWFSVVMERRAGGVQPLGDDQGCADFL